MATLLTENWSYAAGDLWVVTANWTSFFQNAGTVHTDGLGDVFYNHAADNTVGDATYFTSFDLSTQQFTLTVPIKLTRPPTQTGASDDGERQIQIQIQDANTLTMICECTLNAQSAGIGNPSYISASVFDADFNEADSTNQMYDMNGTLTFDLTAGILTLTYNSTLLCSLAVDVGTILTSTSTIYFQFQCFNDSGQVQTPTCGFYGPLVLQGAAAGPVPTTPGLPTASDVQETTATIAWTASTGGTGLLRYQLDINDGLGWTVAGTTTATEFFLTGLTTGTVYGARVHAIDANNVTSATNTNSPAFTTLAVGLFVQGMLPVHNIIPAGDPTPYFTENWPNLTHWSGNTSGTATAGSFVVQGSNTNDITFKTPIPGPPFSLAFNLVTNIGTNAAVSGLDFELNKGTALAGLDLQFSTFGSGPNSQVDVVLNDSAGIVAFSGTSGVNLNTATNSAWALTVAPDGVHASISGTALTGHFIQFGGTTLTVAALNVPIHALTWPATLDVVSVTRANTGFKIT